MLVEVIFKDRNGIESDRSTDQDVLRHGTPFVIVVFGQAYCHGLHATRLHAQGKYGRTLKPLTFNPRRVRGRTTSCSLFPGKGKPATDSGRYSCTCMCRRAIRAPTASVNSSVRAGHS